MNKVKQKVGSVSQFELTLIIGICIMILFFVLQGFGFLNHCVENGNDTLIANTAESVALINSNNGAECVVKDCGGYTNGKHCTHWNGYGYVGYYDDVRNTFVADKPKGYNENPRVKIQNKRYYGARNTLVIKAEIKDGEVILSWVKGKR